MGSITARTFPANKCLNRNDIFNLINTHRHVQLCIVRQFVVLYESCDLLLLYRMWMNVDFVARVAEWLSGLNVCISIYVYWLYVPSGETTVFDVAFRICRPLTIHFISAGGFDGAVVHCSGTMSPTLASVAPVIETWVGATGRIFFFCWTNHHRVFH